VANSFLITREIRGLSKTAAAFASGNYDAFLRPGAIREINITGSTFQTLGSVLKAVQDKSKRELEQAEQSQSDKDLALTYSDISFNLVENEIAGVEIAGRRLDQRNVGDFWGAAAREGGGVAVLGRVAEGKDLNLATSAAAAATFLLQSSCSRTLLESLQEAMLLFPLDICTVIEWTSDAAQWQCHQVDHYQLVDPPHLAACSDEFLVATTLPPATESGVRKLLRIFPLRTSKAIVDELCRCLRESEMGSILALTRHPDRDDSLGA
jgi:hypothetical protein